MTFVLCRGELDREDVRDLLDLHVAAMHAQSPPDACHVLPGDALADPAITFFSVREAGQLAGIGALKALGDLTGEIKSMRTAPAFLRRGVAAWLLAAIVAEAQARDYTALKLETGTGPDFAAANALYTRAGFTDCGPFGDYRPTPFTRFLHLAA